MKGLHPLNKVASVFGSYGWSGEAVKLINQELREMKFNTIDPGLKIQYVPNKQDITTCHELGKRIAEALPPE